MSLLPGTGVNTPCPTRFPPQLHAGSEQGKRDLSRVSSLGLNYDFFFFLRKFLKAQKERKKKGGQVLSGLSQRRIGFQSTWHPNPPAFGDIVG